MNAENCCLSTQLLPFDANKENPVQQQVGARFVSADPFLTSFATNSPCVSEIFSLDPAARPDQPGNDLVDCIERCELLLRDDAMPWSIGLF
jgi:hypothetical protein